MGKEVDLRKFKMKPVPVKPKKSTETISVEIGPGDKMAEIFARLATYAMGRDLGYITKDWLVANMSKINIVQDPSYDEVWDEVAATITVPESDKSYTTRLTDYEKRLAIYQSWRQKHAKEIAAYEAEQLAIRNELTRRRKALESKRAANEKKRLEKILEQTKKQLNQIASKEKV